MHHRASHLHVYKLDAFIINLQSTQLYIHHPDSRKPVFVCPICGKSEFATITELEVHCAKCDEERDDIMQKKYSISDDSMYTLNLAYIVELKRWFSSVRKELRYINTDKNKSLDMLISIPNL